MKTMTTTKKLIISAFFGLALIVGGGAVSGTTAQAQVWRGPRVIFVPRPRVFTYGWGYRYPAYPVYPAYPGPYYYAPSPRYDAGPYDVASEKGYHDGFDRGREDFRDGKRFDPNNSSHFRNSISAGYRDGFRRGYAAGFNQAAG
jgi:hypothetical protein